MEARILQAVMFALALLLCPLLPGIINRVKARFAGRQGPPLLQRYYDLRKLLKRGTVYSGTATWLFRACPVAVPGAALAAAILTPFGRGGALFSFEGDFLVWAGAFTCARVFMILAALDVGSSFEGMGSSREAWYAALAEPAIFLFMAALAVISREYSLSGFFLSLTPETTARHLMALLFAALALFVAILAENARIPVDDPATHLELTMIHEVMLLDHSGPDLAFIEYGSMLKLWVMGALAVGAAVPVDIGSPLLDTACFLAGMLVFAVLIGVLESVMARLRLVRVPQLLVGALVLAAMTVIMVARNS
ncbi:MAG: NADH-quinone oxidoreductase subunit H [Planctomycetota bacterium]|jgi:formate hydrogenlyase subunit 4|nr:NADH-quinone oxidoreductase subunit H [Planctomycetota bacterium]